MESNVLKSIPGRLQRRVMPASFQRIVQLFNLYLGKPSYAYLTLIGVRV